jgi:hypothetical protein
MKIIDTESISLPRWGCVLRRLFENGARYNLSSGRDSRYLETRIFVFNRRAGSLSIIRRESQQLQSDRIKAITAKIIDHVVPRENTTPEGLTRNQATKMQLALRYSVNAESLSRWTSGVVRWKWGDSISSNASVES